MHSRASLVSFGELTSPIQEVDLRVEAARRAVDQIVELAPQVAADFAAMAGSVEPTAGFKIIEGRARALLTISDHRRRYRARRWPRGSYRVPMPEDLIRRRWAA